MDQLENRDDVEIRPYTMYFITNSSFICILNSENIKMYCGPVDLKSPRFTLLIIYPTKYFNNCRSWYTGYSIPVLLLAMDVLRINARFRCNMVYT